MGPRGWPSPQNTRRLCPLPVSPRCLGPQGLPPRPRLPPSGSHSLPAEPRVLEPSAQGSPALAQTLPSVGIRTLPPPPVARKQQTMTDPSGASRACPPAALFLCLCSGWSSLQAPNVSAEGSHPTLPARRPRVERIGWGGAGRALAAGWRSGAQGCFTWVLNLNQIKCLFPGSPAGRVSVPGRMGPEAASSAPPPLAGGVPEAGPETAGGDPSSTGVWDTDRACSWPLAAGPLASVPPRPLTLVLTPAGPRLSSFTSPGLLLRVTGASAFPV